jgi:hypothetical protein
MRHVIEEENMSSRIFFCIAIVSVALVRSSDASNLRTADTSASLHWTSDAKLKRLLKSTRGSITISTAGVEFHPEKGEPIRWTLDDIRTVELPTPRKLSLVSYQNRRWHIPGDRPFDFDLKNPMPPEIAAELVRLVGKPAINGVPVSEDVSSFTIIPARHTTRAGGSNGELRFSDSGIDYLSKAGDARSWRWADIETLAHPEPYRFRVGGFQETFDFELKQPLANGVFDRLWDHVYAQGLNITTHPGGSDE